MHSAGVRDGGSGGQINVLHPGAGGAGKRAWILSGELALETGLAFLPTMKRAKKKENVKKLPPLGAGKDSASIKLALSQYAENVSTVMRPIMETVMIDKPDDIRAYFIDRLAASENGSKLQASVQKLQAANAKQREQIEALEAELEKMRTVIYPTSRASS